MKLEILLVKGKITGLYQGNKCLSNREIKRCKQQK